MNDPITIPNRVRRMISVFGPMGFIGSEFCRQRNAIGVARAERKASDTESIYFISTTDNYNVYEDPLLDIDTNLTVLVEHLRNLSPGDTFNFVSSWFVYGDTELPARETSYCNPKGFYSITKRAAEQLLISYCETFGINYRIFRLCNVYGPGDKPTKKKNALQYLIGELKANRPIELYDGGLFCRDYMHVSDVARALSLCVDQAPLNEIINIGTGREHYFVGLITYAKQALNSKSEIINIAPSDFHKTVQVRDFYMDISKLTALGFESQISIQEGIEELCRTTYPSE